MALIGSADAEAILGISRKTLTARVADGTVPSLGRLGRRGDLVFDRDAIERIAADRARLEVAS